MTNDDTGREAFEQYLPETVYYDPRGAKVYGETSIGLMNLCDIRGWGHLTGGAQAFNLDHETAKKVQDYVGETLADAWNTRARRTS